MKGLTIPASGQFSHNETRAPQVLALEALGWALTDERRAERLSPFGHAIFDLEGQFAVFDVSQADQTGSKRAA